jgi:hypothetical protein
VIATPDCATKVKAEIKDEYSVQGLVKTGAGADTGVLISP